MSAKVLFITNKIPHYRLPLYEAVGKKYDLTIAHCGELVATEDFQQIELTVSSKGPFIKYNGITEIQTYEVVVMYANIRLINLYSLLFRKRDFNIKLILFGIGVSASYDKRYDRDKKLGWLLKKMINRADAAIFYDSYPTIKYSSMGVLPEKMFVAHNTVVANTSPILPLVDRDSLLFIGSLYKQKGIHLLLEAYKLLSKQEEDVPVLNIIGDGPEKASVIKWIDENELSDRIFVLGSITEEAAVRPYFSKALCCVSPGQAGLSVQKSFSYGVPFITSYYPVSGGEFTSIIEGVTGFYYDGSVNDLAVTIKKAIEHPELADIFDNCREFYQRFRSPELWVKGFTDAIKYVLIKR